MWGFIYVMGSYEIRIKGDVMLNRGCKMCGCVLSNIVYERGYCLLRYKGGGCNFVDQNRGNYSGIGDCY